MGIIDIVVKVLIMGLIFAVIGWVYHLIKMATSEKYREENRQEKETEKNLKTIIEKINKIQNNSEFNQLINDPYNADFDLFNLQKYKNHLTNFENENNIANLIFNSFTTRNLWNLENAFEKIKKKNIENESAKIYVNVIKEIDKEKDKVNKKIDNFKIKYREIIQTKLLNKRKENLKISIERNNSKIEEKLSSFKRKNMIEEETFSFVNITDKLDFKEGYNSFVKNFISDFPDLENEIKNIAKFEILDEYIYSVKKELKI